MATSKRKVVVSLDTYLSILAVVSSFCAIGITFYQAYLQRTQQYASVMPVLDIYHTGRFDDGQRGSAITVANFGLGPAFIDSVQYYYRGKSHATMSSIVRTALAEVHSMDTTLLTSDLWKGKVISQEGKIYLYQTLNPKVAAYLYRKGENIGVVVFYRSIYGERWVVDSRNFREGRNRKLD